MTPRYEDEHPTVTAKRSLQAAMNLAATDRPEQQLAAQTHALISIGISLGIIADALAYPERTLPMSSAAKPKVRS